MKALLSVVVGVLFAGALVAFGIHDEIRLGALHGAVVMTESGNALPGASVTLRQLDEPTGLYRSYKTVKTDDSGTFDFGKLPTGSYTIESYAKAHSSKETHISVREGERSELTLSAEPGEPYLRVFAPKHVFLPEAQPELTIEGFGQDPAIDFKLFKIDFDKVVAGGGLQSVLQTAWRWTEGIRTEDPEVYSVIRSETMPIERRDVEGAYVETVGLEALPSGMYWVSARAGSLRSGTYVLVSNIALITKRDGRDIHSFVTHMDTGKAVPGAKLSVYSGSNAIANATTDANGFAKLSLPPAVNGTVTAVAVTGEERAIVPVYLYAESERGIRTAIVTDRPIYRPGHTVQYKGIVRRLESDRYAIVAGTPVAIDIQDSDAITIQKTSTTTDEHGGFSGSFEINPESATGYFTIYATVLGSEQSRDVQVAAYRKPDFEITVSTEKPTYVRGERIVGEVAAEYYFGGAVPEAKVEIAVYRRPYYGKYDEYFADEYSGEYMGDITAVTNGAGKARFTYETSNLRDPESDYVYTFEASVADDSGRYFNGTGGVRVTRGEFELIAIAEGYVVNQNEEARIRIEAQTFDGKPLDVDVDVEYSMEVWEPNNSRVVPMGRTSTETQNGEASIATKATQTGYLMFTARARDSRGNVILSRTGVYVAGEGDWGARTRHLSVKMDKNQYELGDNARAVIIAPKAGDAWVTVEGSGIYISRKVAIQEGGNIVDFEVDERMLPNAYVTVQYVNSATFYEGMAELSIDQTSQKMNVAITPDQQDYEPGETATFAIQATDAATGAPVVADLAFSLVDESIYAIKEDTQDLLEEFYPMRYSSISTGHSFEEIYLGNGDKDSVEMDVRRRFLDTAHWEPTVITDEAGNATVSVVLPDNLTTWRATARGLSVAESLAGQGVSKVRASKPLMVRLNLPRFMVQGDEFEVSATVNTSHEQMDATVTLEASGVVLDDAPRKAVSVGPNSPQTVRWKIRADRAGKATFRAIATSGEPLTRDAVELEIDVIAMGRIVTGHEVGSVSDSKALSMKTDGYVQGSGQVEIVVASSILDTLSGSFDYLIDYPYGCVEQTLSRFVPAVIVSNSPLVRSLSPQSRAKLPQVIEDSFVRLRALQSSDGGWGWWGSDSSEPYMTGLVLESYGLAASAGVSPQPESRNRASEWARQWLATPESSDIKNLSDKLYLLRGLAAVGDQETVASELRESPINRIEHTDDWSSVAIAASRVGNTALANQAIAEIKNRATITETHASWKSEHYGESTTANAILAIATVNPQDPLLPKGARYLLDSRRGAYWHSTQDTATAILALTKAGDQSEQTSESQLVRIISGSETLEVGAISPGSPKRFNIDLDKFKTGQLELHVDNGTMHYAANWRYRVNDQEAKTGRRGDGLTITREYYELRPRRLDSGTLRLLPSGSPVRRLAAGNIVRAVVKITSAKPREFMMLEDPIPAGFEVLERSSDGVSSWEWHFWYSGLDIRDDRIVYFMRWMPEGDHVIEYTLRAESPGKVSALPAVLSNMYEPDDSAFTGVRAIEVTR